jgi:N-acetylneuraminate synthase
MTMQACPIEIQGRRVGPGEPVLIVAELSANHRQRFEDAVRLVEAAGQCGADAVKLQTYTADTLTTRSDRPEFRITGGTPWDGMTLYDLYEQAHTPWAWQRELKQIAERLGLVFLSTPFDNTAIEFLETLGTPAYKIASCEIVDLPLIGRAASTGKPLLLSTGMATFEEIDEAVAAARRSGSGGVALLHCSSAYPAPPQEMHLRTLPRLAETFAVPVGLSDHTQGIAAAVAAVALGACIVEKHLTLSRSEPGLDSEFSLEPAEFRAMVDAVRTAQRALGTVRDGPSPREMPALRLRRSLYVVRDIAAGQPITVENVRSIRPCLGLPPKHLPQVLGRLAARKLSAGTPLDWSDIVPADG